MAAQPSGVSFKLFPCTHLMVYTIIAGGVLRARSGVLHSAACPECGFAVGCDWGIAVVPVCGVAIGFEWSYAVVSSRSIAVGPE